MAESELGRKWDRCLADAVVKIGEGLLVVSGGRRREPSRRHGGPLTGRVEEKPRERSARGVRGQAVRPVPATQAGARGPRGPRSLGRAGGHGPQEPGGLPEVGGLQLRQPG